MISTLRLTVILGRMLGVYFLIFPRLSIKYDARGFYSEKAKNIRCKRRSSLGNYLHESHQRVAFNDVIYSWKLVKSEVPEGFVLNRFLLLT